MIAGGAGREERHVPVVAVTTSPPVRIPLMPGTLPEQIDHGRGGGLRTATLSWMA